MALTETPRNWLCVYPSDSPWYESERGKIYAHLRSGALPSATEVAYFADTQARAIAEKELFKKDISRIQLEMDRLREEMRALKRHRDDLRQIHRMCRGARAPIRKLPIEIVENIFYFLADQKEVMQAGRVCFRWRSVAVSSPRLWSRITWNRTLRTPSRTRHAVDLMLSRSKSLPLDLKLTFTTAWRCLDAARVIFDNSTDRLTSLYVDLSGHYSSSDTSTLRFALDGLKKLQLRSVNQDTLDWFTNCQKITDLTLCDIDSPFLGLVLPFKHLQILRFVSSSLYDIHPILAHNFEAPLQEIQVVSPVHEDYVPTIPRTCSATVLKFLLDPDRDDSLSDSSDSLSDDQDGPMIQDFFCPLKMPDLQSLVLVGIAPPSYGISCPEVLEFIQDAPKLQRLEVSAGMFTSEFSDDDLLNLLKASPSLTSLGLFEEDGDSYPIIITRGVLQALTASDVPEEHPVLPCLRNLELSVRRGFFAEGPALWGESLLKMISSRLHLYEDGCHSVSRLQSVRMSVAKPEYPNQHLPVCTMADVLGKDIFGKLVEIRKVGLEVVTSLPPRDYFAEVP